MSTEATEQLTPIDRPLMRSDLNDIRLGVHDLAEKMLELNQTQGELKEVLAGFTLVHKRLEGIETRLWLPTAVNTFLLVLNVLSMVMR